jgi:ORF6N domain-containing protein
MKIKIIMQLQIIQQKIFEIRGQKVMLDFDLAALYEVETKVLNQAIKRNIKRFPEDFMFHLTRKEWNNLRSQFVTSSLQSSDNQKNKRSQIVTSNYGGTRYLPYAFTEHGVSMAAGILKSDKAVQMNIAIVRAFIALRKFAIQYTDVIEQLKELKDKIGNHDAQLNQIYDVIENLLDEKAEEKKWNERERIGYK